jgi:hypothetical protein
MPVTRSSLEIQSDNRLRDPRVLSSLILKDKNAVNQLRINWNEPATTDRLVTLEESTLSDSVAYKDAAQDLHNKELLTATIASPTDVGATVIPNKQDVDDAITAGTPPATSGTSPGFGTLGLVTGDEDKGIDIAAGVMALKIDGTSVQFNATTKAIETAGSSIRTTTLSRPNFSLPTPLGRVTSGDVRYPIDLDVGATTLKDFQAYASISTDDASASSLSVIFTSILDVGQTTIDSIVTSLYALGPANAASGTIKVFVSDTDGDVVSTPVTWGPIGAGDTLAFSILSGDLSAQPNPAAANGLFHIEVTVSFQASVVGSEILIAFPLVTTS